MIVIERETPRLLGRQVIALFGHGLIGRSITAALGRQARYAHLPFAWGDQKARVHALNSIERHILNHSAGPLNASRLDLIWAAGRSGFDASDQQVAAEMTAYSEIVSFAARLQVSLPDAHHAFHLLSSAGGLFNGQRNVGRSSVPSATNPYGRAKLEQETQLHLALPNIQRLVYRPSSVYGFSGPGTRLGLVSALIHNSIRHQTSRIFGNPHTIRDYVLNSDIGKFIRARLDDPDRRPETYLLVSGKPTTIFEALQKISQVMGRRVYCRFENVRSNAADISFSPAALPRSWQPTDIKTGIQLTARALMASHVSPR
jgi:nucleoside-diphosphate-sugar epimerase